MRLPLSVLALSTALCACTVAPGDYVIIRLASATPEQSTSCYPNMVIPEGEAEDSTNFRTGGSIAVYAVDAETVYLEYDVLSIEGTRDGKDYAFSGTDVDVEYIFNPMSNANEKQTSTTETRVSMTIDGSNVTGRNVTTASCNGYACPYVSCVTTTEFVGSVIRGVDLEHAI